MKNILLLLYFIFTNTSMVYSQYYAPKKAEKIMFVDSEYILEKIPRYKIAQSELNKTTEKWQKEIDEKYMELKKLETDFANEKILLTDDLIDEKEKEIREKKQEINDLENKYFGPSGLYISEKYKLVKPIQNLIFTAVHELAQEKNYDYVFDKSGDLLMIYYNPALDISELIIKKIKDL